MGRVPPGASSSLAVALDESHSECWAARLGGHVSAVRGTLRDQHKAWSGGQLRTKGDD